MAKKQIYLPVIGSSDQIIVPTGTALDLYDTITKNTERIQAAIDAGGKVTIEGKGTYYINNTLYIGDDTHLYIEYGVEIRQYPGTNKTMLMNRSLVSSTTAVTH